MEIAKLIGINISDISKSLNSLKEILPTELIPIVHKPINVCSKIRNKKHGISQEKIGTFPAFDTFNKDLLNVAIGLEALRVWLEKISGIKAEICLKREKSMDISFPKLIGPPRPEYKLQEMKKVEGKTIERVEFGEEEPNPEVHQSEAIVLHFSDGTAMAIRVGSNAVNLKDYKRKLKPIDFSTDLTGILGSFHKMICLSILRNLYRENKAFLEKEHRLSFLLRAAHLYRRHAI